MAVRITRAFHVQRSHQRIELRSGDAPAVATRPEGRVPRISRLMALAIRFDDLVRAGHVADYATLARLGHVTRARVTQIMNLLLLAPAIQEDLLFLPMTQRGRDRFHIGQLQPIALTPSWKLQLDLWRDLQKHTPERHS